LKEEELPALPQRKQAPTTLHEVRRRDKLREIDMQNARFAKKLLFINSTVPGQKSLKKEFKEHEKRKSMRCKWPIVNMKKNVFSQE
jgi:hypothetical protein